MAMRMICALGLLLATPLAAQQADDPELTRVKALYETALDGMLSGDSTAWMALLSDRADVSLFPPYGGTRVGQAAVRRQYGVAVSQFPAGTVGRGNVEYLTAVHEGDLAYFVSVEHPRVQRPGEEAKDNMTRATIIFRREAGRWRLVHRHMDHIRPNPSAPGGP